MLKRQIPHAPMILSTNVLHFKIKNLTQMTAPVKKLVHEFK